MLLQSWNKVQLKIENNQPQSSVDDLNLQTRRTNTQRADPIIGHEPVGYFYTKSIKIFDYNQLLNEILVEQYVPTNPKQRVSDETEGAQPISYDVSTLYWDRYMYYFKRIRNPTTMKTCLRLHRLNLIQVELDKHTFDEPVRLKDEEGQDYFVVIHEPDEVKFNTKFVHQIGDLSHNHNSEGTEQQFLQQNFVVIQMYMEDSEQAERQEDDLMQFQIYSLKDLSTPITAQIKSRQPIGIIENAYMIMNYYNGETNISRFILEDANQMTMIKFKMVAGMFCFHDSDQKLEMEDKDFCKKANYESFRTLTTQYFRHRCPPRILNEVLADETHQYFTFSQQGQVQLIFPLYVQRMRQMKVVDNISEKTRIRIKRSDLYTKVIKFTPDPNEKFTFQKIRNLKEILGLCTPLKALQQMSFFFGEDRLHQHVCVLDPTRIDGRAVTLISMSQNKCRFCDSQAKTRLHRQALVTALLSESRPNKLDSHYRGHNDLESPDFRARQGSSNKHLLSARCDGDRSACDIRFSKIRFQGQKKQVLLFDEQEWLAQLKIENTNDMHLVVVQSVKAADCHLFIVALTVAEACTGRPRKVYLFVQRTISELQAIIDSDKRVPLLGHHEAFKVLVGPNVLEAMNLTEVAAFLEENEKFKVMKLVPLAELDERQEYSWVPAVCLLKDDPESNCVMVYDVKRGSFGPPQKITPDKQRIEMLHFDQNGFMKVLFAQTSSLQTQLGKQIAKFSLFQFFVEEFGRIRVQDFVIGELNESGLAVKLVGLKQIMFSNEVLEHRRFEDFIQNADVVAYREVGVIRGCELRLTGESDMPTDFVLELHEQAGLDKRFRRSSTRFGRAADKPKQQLYTHKSDVVFIGTSVVQMDHSDPRKVAMVISAYLRSSLIERNVFSNQEALHLLQRANNKCMAMRIADLKYLVCNTFEDIQRNDFFQTQEILEGKSVCDISITDPKSVSEALQQWPLLSEEDRLSKQSCLEFITQKDRFRVKLFQTSGYYFRQTLINYDFNFQGTTQRALESNSSKSINAILEAIFEYDTSPAYRELLNLDMVHIFASEKVEVPLYFSRQALEQRVDAKALSAGICTFESVLADNELPTFSSLQSIEHLIKDVSSYSNIEVEVLEQYKVFQAQRQEVQVEHQVEVEHFFMDFSAIIIGHKLKYLASDSSLRFDSQTLAQYLAREKLDDLDFFRQPSIQMLIDSQWRVSYKINLILFIIYATMYMIPMINFCLEKDSVEDKQLAMLNIAMVPTVILLYIELTQLWKYRLAYFHGWNITDMLWLIIFICFYLMHYFQVMHELNPIFKMAIIILMFAKFLFFVRIFDRYGFMVDMLKNCLYDLIPFIGCFFSFLFLFSFCLISLDAQIDGEVEEAVKALGYVQLTILQAFRTSIGELGSPQYPQFINENGKAKNWLCELHITLIWVVWYIQAFTMLVVMLNFIIAVINATYERVSQDQAIINYKYKAELNLETFDLLSHFGIRSDFKAIVFQRVKEEQKSFSDPVLSKIQEVKNVVQNQGRKAYKAHQDIETKFKNLKQQQEGLIQSIQMEFKQMQLTQQNLSSDLIQTKASQTGNIKQLMQSMQQMVAEMKSNRDQIRT